MTLKSSACKLSKDQILLHAYVGCALWSSTDEKGNPLDDGRGISDLPEETLAAMQADVTEFVATNLSDIEEAALDEEQVGHDLWLTRNGHGAGFWDRGLGAVGDRLAAACRALKSVELYVGDDGLVYQQ